VTIRNVIKNSPAAIAGISSPAANAAPTSKERIISVNSEPVKNTEEYYELIREVPANSTILIQTSMPATYTILKGNLTT
jgi:S1-C subfamily serine protease